VTREATEKQRERYAREVVKRENAAADTAAQADPQVDAARAAELERVREAEETQRAEGETALAAAARHHAALLRKAELKALEAVDNCEALGD